jgi:hypothetical protein
MITQNTNCLRDRLLVWRVLKLLMSLVLLTQTGCYSFGAPYMSHDIDAYNRRYLAAEQSMLLYNMGLLRDDQPPHFMMLSSVNQSRTFSAGGGFQWSQALAALNPVTAIANVVSTTKTVTTTSSSLATGNAWEAGPFTVGTVENPIFTFTPIQGQDFANRFETSLTDKFTKFLEDQRWIATAEEQAEIVRLFAESLALKHGETWPDAPCKSNSLYPNARRSELPGLKDLFGGGYLAFDRCLDQIISDENRSYTIIDGVAHQVPTAVSGKPAATDLVTALGAGYEWTTNGGDFVLSNPVRLPAWLDYHPEFTPPSPKDKSDRVELEPAFWFGTEDKKGVVEAPDLSKLAANYSWKRADDGKYILVPDGYAVDTNRRHLIKEPPFTPSDQPAYANEIVKAVWPVPQDYFYVELRNESDTLPQWLTDKQVENVCVDQAPTTVPPGQRGAVSSAANPKMLISEHGAGHAPTKANEDPAVATVICGYFKIGNLLEVFKHLAKRACDETIAHDPNDPNTDCSQSIFGVGPKAPPWARISTDYTYPRPSDGEPVTESIWMPAHNPSTPKGQRDERVFQLVYKLYQMSLVDTSKLVTGSIPITKSQ